MSVDVTQSGEEQFRSLLKEVAASLASTEFRSDGAYISTPVYYPGGATVVVRVEGGPSTFYVTDFGMAFNECDLMGSTSFFTRNARTVAENAGVGFDQHSFFITSASRSQLPEAIATIANCSAETVVVCAYKMAERSKASADSSLYYLLKDVFPKDSVARDVEFRGSTHHPWPISAQVRTVSGLGLFESVTKNHVSAVSAYAKFKDIGGLKKPPVLVSVVRNKEEFGTYLDVLASASNVIEIKTSSRAIRNLLEAA